MKRYGLIGHPLSHTFSPAYFKIKFEQGNIDASYEAFDLEDLDNLEEFVNSKKLDGFNITLPYKKAMRRKCDVIDPLAKRVGAINTVKIIDGKWHGFNTDVLGFRKALKDQLGYKRAAAIVLGTGGASLAVKSALELMSIPYLVVSRNTRSGDLSYNGLTKRIFEQYNLLINTTPVGMAPNINDVPEVPFEFLTENHYVYDLVYNPVKTKFLELAEKQGANIQNGLEMLHQQAEESWKIWNK